MSHTHCAVWLIWIINQSARINFGNVSADHRFIKKKKKGSLFCNFKFLQVQCLCCDNAVIMTWLGKETTWICLGNNCILAYLILAPLDGWKLSQPIIKNMNLFIHLVCQKHAWKLSRLVRNAHGFVFKSC